MTALDERPPGANEHAERPDDLAWNMGRRGRRQSLIRLGIAVVVLGVLVGAGLWYRSWTTWQSPMEVSSWRVTVEGLPVEVPDDGSPIVVDAAENRIVALEMALDTPGPVDITEVDVRVPPRAPVRLFAVQSAEGPAPDDGEQPWGDFQTFDPTSEASQRMGMVFRVLLVTSTEACSDFRPGAEVDITELDITYEARQRTRETTVALPATIAVRVPDGGCR